MRLGRRRPPVLAEISGGPPEGAGPGALRRADMEAYGALLERLDGARTVLLVPEAGQPGSAALGLATTAAAAGRRTVLIECDLARPRLAEALGLATAPGVGEYLRGEAEARELLKPVVLAGPGAGGATEPLLCVVAGRPVDGAASLLDSDRLRRALAEIAAAYELAVIAGPPLEGDPSPAILRPHVDSAIACVARANRRRKPPLPVTGLLVHG